MIKVRRGIEDESKIQKRDEKKENVPYTSVKKKAKIHQQLYQIKIK